MILSHRIQLCPTYSQKQYFAQASGCARFVWNWAVEEWERQFSAGEKPTGNKLQKQFNSIKYERYPWMSRMHRDAHARPFSAIDRAYRMFRSGISRRPSFHKKGRTRDSFYLANDVFHMRGMFVSLPKIGAVKLTEKLRFIGKITGAVVSRTADRWFISIQVDVGEYRKQRTGDGIVGVDLGIATAATVSNGQCYEGPRALNSGLKKLRRCSRQHSRKQKGSKNREKSAKRLATLHARIANIRKDFLHKTTTNIMRENQAVFVEDLRVSGMIKNRRLARAIADSGWREFRRQAEYKAVVYGSHVGVIDQFFPSSKTCRKCGQLREDLHLSDRVFNCDGCGHSEDRDLNAAHNIRSAGLAQTYACGPEGSGVDRKIKPKPRRVEAGTDCATRTV